MYKQVRTPALLKKTLIFGAAIALLVAGPLGLFLSPKAKAAACQVPSPSYGSVTTTINAPATATYKIWSRVMAPDTTNNAYLLEIDGADCYTVGGAGITPNTWTWVDYKDASTGSKITRQLTQGQHNVKLIGSKPSVKVDRVLAVGDLQCTPTGFGDNCNNPPDTTPPAVNITQPAENAVVSGQTIITADASDAGQVTKVEFYDNSNLLSTATNAPYSFAWDTTQAAGGQHRLTAKAYDTTGNTATDSVTVTVQNDDNQPPTLPTGLNATAPAYNEVQLKWTASTDNVGVVKYLISRNQAPLAEVGAVNTFKDTTTQPDTTYSYQVTAYDAAGNSSGPSAAATVKTPSVPAGDTQPPTAPTGLTAKPVSSRQVNLSWQPSTDNVGVVAYDVYHSENGETPHKLATVTSTSYGDTGLSPNTKVEYFVIAKDAAGNASQPSEKVSTTTKKQSRYGVIRGTVKDKDTGRAITNATVTAYIGKYKFTTQTTRGGKYRFQVGTSGTYNLTATATQYNSHSFTSTVEPGKIQTEDVLLQRRSGRQ